MARVNEEGQWIVLMGFLVALAILLLALIVSQKVLVGQSTAEGVLKFPKNEIRNLRSAISGYLDAYEDYNDKERKVIHDDIVEISLERNNAVVNFTVGEKRHISGRMMHPIEIYYNDGTTSYNETTYY